MNKKIERDPGSVERDLRRAQMLAEKMNNAENEMERLNATTEVLDIISKYDYFAVQEGAKKLTLTALEALRRIAETSPVSADSIKAKMMLEEYEKQIFPPTNRA